MAENNEPVEEFQPSVTDAELINYLELEPAEGEYSGFEENMNELSPEETAALLAAGTKPEGEKPNEGLTPAESETEPEGEGETNGDPELTPQDELILKLLEAKGIKDGLVKIENEDGTEEDIAFADLTEEEQLNILNTSVDDLALSDSELSAVEFLRTNNVTLEQTIEYFTKKAVAEATATQTAEKSVAEYTDEEIYAFDLIQRFKDWTEEDIQLELDKQQEHPELFKRKVDALREEYLQLEKDSVTQQEADAKRLEEEEFEKITNTLVEVARGVEDIGGLDIELEDKQEVLGFILNKDVNGVTDFAKLMDDPKQLFELAWYAKKGKEAFQTIHDYYKNEITEASRKGYEKGKAEAKPATKTNPLRTAIKPKQTNNPNFPVQDDYTSLDDLHAGIIKTQTK